MHLIGPSCEPAVARTNQRTPMFSSTFTLSAKLRTPATVANPLKLLGLRVKADLDTRNDLWDGNAVKRIASNPPQAASSRTLLIMFAHE